MQLNRINKTSATEVVLSNGNTVLFSYSTPVACHIPGMGFYRTSKSWSRTTSKHINQWITRHGGSGKCFTMEQTALDGMVQ